MWENFDRYNREDNLTKEAEAENPYFWLLKARGQEWYVKPPNWNSAGSYSMQTNDLKHVKIIVDRSITKPIKVDFNGTIYMATWNVNFKTTQ